MPRWVAREAIVGTRPESVVNRRIKPPRPSWDCKGWGSREPFRGGETRPTKEESFLRKRNSSILSLVLFVYAIFSICYTVHQVRSALRKQGSPRPRWGFRCDRSRSFHRKHSMSRKTDLLWELFQERKNAFKCLLGAPGAGLRMSCCIQYLEWVVRVWWRTLEVRASGTRGCSQERRY